MTINLLGEYSCVPVRVAVKSENQAPNVASQAIVALYPGVRTFMTAYSVDGEAIEWGKGDVGAIFRLCLLLDKLQSATTDEVVRHRKRYRLKRKARKIRKKIRCLVDELHRKLALWLCENYRVILLPDFKTQGMVRKGERKIGSNSARKMCTLSHYRFKTFLKHKAIEHPWVKIVDVAEEFTSKTCGGCGEIHAELKGKKVFKCPHCNYEADRDVNGARNILIKYLTDCELRPVNTSEGGNPPHVGILSPPEA